MTALQVLQVLNVVKKKNLGTDVQTAGHVPKSHLVSEFARFIYLFI